MASYPPPYSPPPGTPFGFDPTQQKRLLKAQMRMQQAARRSQKRLYQSQLRSMRRSSLLAPIIIVAAGLLLLLARTGHLQTASLETRFNQWWPITLVVAGGVLILEWVFDRSSLTTTTPYIRRGAGGGIFLLVLLLLGTGSYLNNIHGDQPFRFHGFGITADNIAEVFGEKHERDEQLNLPIPRGTALSFYNPHGDITIIGRSDDDHVHIQVNKQLFSTSDAETDSKASQLSPKITWTNGIMELTLPRLNGAQADLSITAPDSDPITVNTGDGDIHVSGMRAAVNITQDRGDVELSQLVGPVITHINNNNSSFSADDVHGDLSLKGHAQDLSLSQIAGRVSLEGDFYGDTHLEHLTGPIEFRTNRTQFTLARLDGQVDISPDEDLIANQIVGPTVLSTRSRNLSLDRITGDLTVTNSNGTVDVTGAAPLANVRIENRNGAVNLTVPAQTGFILDAQSQDGNVSNDFDIPESKTGSRTSLQGSVGDGHAHISLSTSHADVALHKGDVQPPSPIPPPPAPPAPPTRHSSRIHATPTLSTLTL